MKKAKKIKTVDKPGKKCPNCGAKWAKPIGSDMMYPSYEEEPHKDIAHCIQFLKGKIDSLRDALGNIGQSNMYE